MIKHKAVYRGGSGEIIEKKSRFIANVKSVETVEEAQAYIEEMRKKYWDARHNCSAFSVGTERVITRCSDDGEPGGTAGKPILEVISGSGIHNIVVVVTRYFGGTLLGTGGLVRAYTSSARLGIDAAGVCNVTQMAVMNIKMDYSFLSKLQNFSEKGLFKIEDIIYEDMITAAICCDEDKKEDTRLLIANMTSGKFEVVFEGDKLVNVEI